jgi:hypothetical protein
MKPLKSTRSSHELLRLEVGVPLEVIPRERFSNSIWTGYSGWLGNPVRALNQIIQPTVHKI